LDILCGGSPVGGPGPCLLFCSLVILPRLSGDAALLRLTKLVGLGVDLGRGSGTLIGLFLECLDFPLDLGSSLPLNLSVGGLLGSGTSNEVCGSRDQ
jgi:hypothetical protein